MRMNNACAEERLELADEFVDEALVDAYGCPPSS
jgi:hypothetical protein